jgi:bacillithiol system protein YtxJ
MKTDPASSELIRVRSIPELDIVLGAAHAVLYKHSPICGSSLLAFSEVRRFAADHPDTPVYLIDVVAGRVVSEAAAERLGVTHESPQVILLEHGEVVWSASHRGVKADALAAHLPG